MKAVGNLKHKRLIFGGAIVMLLAVGSFAFMQFQTTSSANQKTTQAITTATVQIGDLTSEISGTGKIVALNTIDLAFSTTGKIAEVDVNPGKKVVEGDVLAKLDQITNLQMDVDNKKLLLAQAQQTLDNLNTNKEVALANALIAQSDAAAALEAAQYGVVDKHSSRCEKDVTEQYYYDYMYDRHDYLYWYNAFIKKNTGYGDMYIQERMAPLKVSMTRNYENWKYCEGFTDLEINQSKSTLDLAESNYQAAKDYYEKLKVNNGVDPDALAIAETTSKNADLQLQEAQRILDGATLTSPTEGTVLTVAAAVGETLDSDTFKSPFISIADLTKPILQSSFDETDLAVLSNSCTVQAAFTSHAGMKYEGTIIQINPALAIQNGVSTAQAYIQIIDPVKSEKIDFPVGANATVDLNCPIAKNALLVPLQALKNEDNGTATVYVQKTDGTTEAIVVTIGVKSSSKAEVSGNLNVGDVVITSSINTKTQ